jgi:hypothetical protein
VPNCARGETELGPERFTQLKALLFAVWDSPLVR